MKTIEILFECLESDTGDRTYKVSSRVGASGDNPPRFIIHHSHFADDAIHAARRSIKAAANGQIDKITGPRMEPSVK